MDPKDYEIDPADDIDLDRQEVHAVRGGRVNNVIAKQMAAEAELAARARKPRRMPGESLAELLMRSWRRNCTSDTGARCFQSRCQSSGSAIAMPSK